MILSTKAESMILSKDIDKIIFNSFETEETNKHIDSLAADKASFKSGMIYAALLISTKAFRFTDCSVPKDVVGTYEVYMNELEDNNRWNLSL